MRSARYMIIASMLGVILLSGCSEPGEGAAGRGPSTVQGVVLVDWSTSGYQSAGIALEELIGELIGLAEPGSPEYDLDFRLITDRSWSPDAALGRLVIPAIAEAPAELGPCPNPVDPELCERLRREHDEKLQSHMQRVATVREQVANRLGGLANIATGPTPGTDIEGALQAAETALSSAPWGAERWLIILSDLRHCLGSCELKDIAPVRLPGVRVVVAGFGDSGTGDAVLVRDAFTRYFGLAGAQQITFLLSHQSVVAALKSATNNLQEVN